MMIDRKSTFFLGVFVFMIPFLGFPTFWKTFFTVFAGVVLILMSVKVSIYKRPQKKIPKERVTPVVVENVPPIVYPKNDTIEVQSQVVEVKEKSPVKRTRTRKTNGPVV